MTWNRGLSLGAYLLGTALIGHARGADAAAVFAITQVFAVMFIWFADYFGDWLGQFPMPGGWHRPIDQETPGWLVATAAWLILIGVFATTWFYA